MQRELLDSLASVENRAPLSLRILTRPG